MCGKDLRPEVNIVGGTYYEVCLNPSWDQIYGSGLRAALVVRDLNPEARINLYTYADKYAAAHLELYKTRMDLNVVIKEEQQSARFSYLHSLRSPHLGMPIFYGFNTIFLRAENCIVFGLVEGASQVFCNKAVYDPQSPNAPHSFWESGSKTNHLAVVLNEKEAVALSNKTELLDIRDALFESEKCEVLVIKRGAKGAIVYDDRDSEGRAVPVFKTDRVWSIGSGDVFTSVFGYYWMIENMNAVESSVKASLAAACYCNEKEITGLFSNMRNAQFESLQPRRRGNVYLAGPIFTMAQLMFIDECRNSLKELGCDVFSPYHDVGIGDADDVVPKDIQAIEDCDVMFALLDGMDPGTVFEVGYAVAKGKRVVVFVQNEEKTHLQMMIGTQCSIENDFVTAMYKCAWYASE